MLALCVLLVFLIVRRLTASSERLTGAATSRRSHSPLSCWCAWGGRLAAAQSARRPGARRRHCRQQGQRARLQPRHLLHHRRRLRARGRAARALRFRQLASSSRASRSADSSVNDSSRANYYWTFLSLASSLNYDYLQDIAAPLFADAEDTERQERIRPRGRLARTIAPRISCARAATASCTSSRPRRRPSRNPYADEQVDCGGSLFEDEYFRALAEVTWLKAVGSLATTDLAECHKLRLRVVGDQARKPGPKFVFAHFLPPHHPYLFDRHGNVLKHVTVSNQFDFQAQLWEDKHGYLEQVLLHEPHAARSDRPHPRRIGASADHHRAVGPRPEPASAECPREQAMAVRFANFAAYLLPGAPPGRHAARLCARQPVQISLQPLFRCAPADPAAAEFFLDLRCAAAVCRKSPRYAPTGKRS